MFNILSKEAIEKVLYANCENCKKECGECDDDGTKDVATAQRAKTAWEIVDWLEGLGDPKYLGVIAHNLSILITQAGIERPE